MWVQRWSTPLFWELKGTGPTKHLDPMELGQHFIYPYIFSISNKGIAYFLVIPPFNVYMCVFQVFPMLR